MWSRASISAMVLLAGGGALVARPARADGAPAPDDPVAWLASRSELQLYDRIAVLAGDAGREAASARDAVARVLLGAGHDVATLAGTSVGADRQKLVAACRGFDALAIVRNSTKSDKPTVVVTLYGPRGDLLAALDGPGLPPPAWPPRALAAAAATSATSATAAPSAAAVAATPSAPRLTLGPAASRLSGPAFYEAMGRPDLASRYRRRRATKIAVMSAGGGVAVAGVVLTLGDILLTELGNSLRCTSVGWGYPFPWLIPPESTSTPTCQRDEANPWPFLIMIGAGMATTIVGATIEVDPLTPAERRALQPPTGATSDEPPVRRGEAGFGQLQIGAAPTGRGDGGSLFLRGRF